MDRPIRSYRDLATWQVARDLCLEVYRISMRFPKDELFGLTSQMRRASVSIPSNIAEGFGRQSAKEKQQFYHHSLGSLFELETQADISRSLGYVDAEQSKTLTATLNQCRKLLLGLLNANRAKITNPQSLIRKD